MKKIRVLVIDDSQVIREIVKECLAGDEQIEVVGEAEDPFVARELIKELAPDVLTLDVEMPKMDGITFLANLMRLRPMPVIMLSTLTTKGADITLEALELGAIDFIAKPSFEHLIAHKDSFKSTLIYKIKQCILIDQKNYQLTNAIKSVNTGVKIHAFTGVKRKNHLVAIGASTGGTEALKGLVATLPENSPPVVIVQHIPETFSLRFAERMNEKSVVTVQEAQHGQKIKLGNVYVAPGDQHLKVIAKGGSLFCALEDSERVNRHKPAVDVLFDSLQEIAGNVQAVLLTGMGNDGAQGMLNLKELGARTVIQDKATSLVWGMPGSAHKLNAHTCEVSLNKIAKVILAYAKLNKAEMKEILYEH